MTSYCYNCFRPIAPGETVCPNCGRRHAVNDQPLFALPLGTQLHAGKYLTGRVLGQGGFGITYVGYDLALELKVAIKEYFPVHMASRSQGTGSLQWHSTAAERDLGRESFVKEARKMAKTHAIPNVVDVRDVFFENDTAYIVMDFLEGETLRDRLKRTGPMSPGDCVEVLRPVMLALEKAHQRGLIHRDVSPDNIMRDPDGEVWLLDLGAAKVLDVGGTGTQSTAPVMKRGFSPPEQYASGGKIGPWTDVYAMCATIYYCVTGRMVPEAMDRMMGEALTVPDTVPACLADALRRGLALQPEERFQSMGELLEALDSRAPGSSETEKPAAAVPPELKRQTEPHEKGTAAGAESEGGKDRKAVELPDGAEQENLKKRRTHQTSTVSPGDTPAKADRFHRAYLVCTGIAALDCLAVFYTVNHDYQIDVKAGRYHRFWDFFRDLFLGVPISGKAFLLAPLLFLVVFLICFMRPRTWKAKWFVPLFAVLVLYTLLVAFVVVLFALEY